jgi:hypothetical protein
MNSGNFGARIMKNGALCRKIWLWKIWRAKVSFWKILGYLWNVLVAESFGTKEQGLL